MVLATNRPAPQIVSRLPQNVAYPRYPEGTFAIRAANNDRLFCADSPECDTQRYCPPETEHAPLAAILCPAPEALDKCFGHYFGPVAVGFVPDM